MPQLRRRLRRQAAPEVKAAVWLAAWHRAQLTALEERRAALLSELAEQG
jgi:hypothetical protein